MICSDGESSISRYAGVGRQLHPQKPMEEILRNELDNFLSLLLTWSLCWTKKSKLLEKLNFLMV